MVVLPGFDMALGDDQGVLPIVLDRSLFDHGTESERCLTPAHIQ